MKLPKLFKRKSLKVPAYIQIEIVDEKRKWYKNGKHRLKQELVIYDANGNQIGYGRINRRFNPKKI